MAYEIRPNSGSLFRNDKRETENHANATGTVNIDGVEYWISAWTKTKENGEKWQSLSFKRKEPRAGSTMRPEVRHNADFDDSPF